MNCTSKFIWVTLAREGIHCYPEAANDPELESVNFLSFPHRHIFFMKVELEVTENNREVEFIIFKRWLESLFGDGVLQLNNMSCEMISDQLAEKVMDKYPGRRVRISVSEDNENGSYAEYGD